MRGTIVGIIGDLNELLIKFDNPIAFARGDVVNVDLPNELRSKNANAYYWELNGRLAKKMGISGDIIYRNHIRDISCRECYFMLTEAVPRFEKLWVSKHLGRFVETRESKEEGKTIVLAYYGSSDFDTTQMSHLIDNCIQDCKDNDVPIFNQDEINEAVAKWQRTHQA